MRAAKNSLVTQRAGGTHRPGRMASIGKGSAQAKMQHLIRRGAYLAAALVAIYEAAAGAAEDEGRDDAAGFFMTHAYVFALEAGLDDAARLKAWLMARNRESEG